MIFFLSDKKNLMNHFENILLLFFLKFIAQPTKNIFCKQIIVFVTFQEVENTVVLNIKINFII